MTSAADDVLAALDAAISAAAGAMTLASPALCAAAGGPEAVRGCLAAIENVWIAHGPVAIHADLHRSVRPKAVVVFQPGSGAHARFYFLLGALLARAGYHVLAVDRPGHGLSPGPRGDCTVEEALAAAHSALNFARQEFGLPTVLMGSSMGGLLTVFGVLQGLAPDLAVAHNFLYPGKLLSFRLRARWIARFRKRPYPLTELVHGFERLSADPAIVRYLRERNDPGAAWALTARSVASLFGFRVSPAANQPPVLIVTGGADTAIPAWATRAFSRWSGLRWREVSVIPGAGHLLFHDHLAAAVPVVTAWLDSRLPSRG